MNQRLAVVIGVGNLGRLYAGGLLRAGYSLAPIRRETDPAPVLLAHPPGTPLLCAVGEADLAAVIDAVPVDRRCDLLCLQNELFPADLDALGAPDAGLAVAWTLAKPGFPVIVGRRAAASGAAAPAFARACEALGHPCVLSDDPGWEAATKYAFIVAVNALGLCESTTLERWVTADRQQVEVVVRESCALALARIGESDRIDDALSEVWEGIHGFGPLPCRGRSSRSRVARALERARELGTPTPHLRSIAASE